MQQRRITGATELHRRLRAAGASLSRQAVFRMIKTAPERLSLQTLDALCVVLDCSPNDLLEVTNLAPQPQKVPPPPDFMLRKMS